MVVIGDVAGRGAEAAVLTALARYTLRTVGRFVGEPLAMVEHLNEALRERHDFSLVSVCCALLYEERGTASARVVLAGHPPAYLVRGGIPEQIGDFGTLPGAREIGNWSEVTVTLAPGDQLVLYTDGVIDTVGESERFGEDRLRDALIGASGAADAVSRIETGISRFERGAQADDTAVLAVQRTTRGDVSDAGPASGLAGESAPARLEPRGSRFTAASGRVSPQR
jgi:sigma-B regulation protein RsbU (phosphoserine phosphatase)